MIEEDKEIMTKCRWYPGLYSKIIKNKRSVEKTGEISIKSVI